MMYYHCSPLTGLRLLQPGRPEHFEKPAAVYLTTSLPMALMYGISNFEYSYGYTREGQIYYDEYFPDALEILYGGKSASLYLCAPLHTTATKIPNETVSADPVPVVEEIWLPDVREALLEQERLGTLMIHRYEQLSEKMLEWIRNVEAEEIRTRNLIHTGGPMADYMRTYYPESWAMVEAEEQEQFV